jgi:two-component system cell cycle sensor histidine kinase/response regulator CckA
MLREGGAMKALLVGIASESESIVANVLGAQGHEQITVDDGSQALGKMGLVSPALLIVQDPLPDMSASELCRQVRLRPEGVDAIILVIATRNIELPALLEAGANDLYATSVGPGGLAMRVRIAERLVAQHARLRNREVRFRRLFDSGVAGVIISDVDGNFKEANDAFLRMLGYSREDMLGGKLNWGVISPMERLVPDTEERAQLRSTGFLPLRERVYVHKDGHHIAALVGSAALEGTTECISYVADISLRKREEDTLRASEEQYRILFEQAPTPKFLYDHATLSFLSVNESAVQHYGYTRPEFLRMTIKDIRPKEDLPAFLAGLHATGGKTKMPMLRRHTKKDGTVIDVEVTDYKLTLGSRACGLAVAVDVTERNRMESQLRQAQKMEAIGSLAGGVAHDFNNLLSVVLSYAEMLSADIKPGDPMRQDLEEISGAGKRAAGLTRQLLAFGRQQILRPVALDLNAVIGAITNMLTRVVGEDLELTIVSAPDLWTVKADPGQIEQVLMNLVINARDAMPTGGTLTIETANVELDSAYAASHAGVAGPGRYVMLAVADTGSGMDAATRDRIFEPFFTTKEKGKGTGLGLSTVFGIVQQSGGSVSVASEQGEGATFRVYLPQAGPASSGSVETALETGVSRGSETILLVEDEETVRILVRRILEARGYLVLDARSAGDALLLCEQHKGTIHLLLTDVVMPRMSGRELADRLAPLRPEMKVLYMSGYTDDAVIRHGIRNSEVAFLQKPITPETLTRKLREVLESKGGSRPHASTMLVALREDDPHGGVEAASGTFSVSEQARRKLAGLS